MTQPGGASAPIPVPATARRAPAVTLVPFASMLLVGLGMMLVPSLIRQVQEAFGVDDAAMGMAYLLNSAAYIGGALVTGVLARHVPRALLLAGGAAGLVVGCFALVATGAWPVFLAAFMLLGMGVGILDAGTNALLIDLAPGRSGLMTRAHLFAGIGGLTAPLAVGTLVGGGLPWQATAIALAVLAAVVGAWTGSRVLTASHTPVREPVMPGSAGPLPAAVGSGRRSGPSPALVALAVGVACYVAMELGVANWLVRYLADAPLGLATGAVALFWGMLTLSRLVSSFLADRLGTARYVVGSAALGVVAVVAAVAAPTTPLAIAGFAVAGFAAGPIYPGIMTIAGALHPGRSGLVSSVLSASGVAGTVIWPPLMGVISETAGLGVGMIGTAAFLALSGAAVIVAPRLAGPSDGLSARAS